MCVEPCAQSPPLDDVCGMPVPPKVQFGCGYNTLALATTIVKSKIASGREICQQGKSRRTDAWLGIRPERHGQPVELVSDLHLVAAH